MEIICIICSDLITHNSEVVLNKCGHMFHHKCLISWLQRSETCPQCHRRATQKYLYRVFFNLANAEHKKDDVGRAPAVSRDGYRTVQAKLDSGNSRIQMLNKELKEMTEKANSQEARNIKLKGLVYDLKKIIVSHESSICGLKAEVGVYKAKASEVGKLKLQVSNLKSTLKDMGLAQSAICGTWDEVNEMIRNETKKSLALLSATLKKSLTTEVNQTTMLRRQLQHSQNETMKYKRCYNNLRYFTLKKT